MVGNSPKARAAALGENGDGPAQAAVSGIVREYTSEATGEWHFTLSNGIRLKFTAVSPQVIRMAVRQVPEPQPPMVPGVDDKPEPNPDDPAYIERQHRYVEDSAIVARDVAFMLGCTVEDVPAGMYAPDDDEWVEAIEIAGVVIDRDEWGDNPKRRMLAWLNLYAITVDEDVFMATQLATRQWGLTEEEVQRDAASFRSVQGRRTDLIRAAVIGGQDGDHVPADGAGDSAGV